MLNSDIRPGLGRSHMFAVTFSACTKCEGKPPCPAQSTCNPTDGECYCQYGYSMISERCIRNLAFTQRTDGLYASETKSVPKGVLTHHVAIIPARSYLVASLVRKDDSWLTLVGRASLLPQTTSTSYMADVIDNTLPFSIEHKSCNSNYDSKYAVSIWNGNPMSDALVELTATIKGDVNLHSFLYQRMCHNQDTNIYCYFLTPETRSL